MLLTVLTLVVLALYGGLIFYYFHHWTKLADYKPTDEASSVFVSVLVAARNEEATLPHLLADLQQQRYPPHLFEVIIINDHSTDDTGGLAATLPPNMSMFLPDAPPEASSKKIALASAVKRAKGPLLLVTDADCRVGPDWVHTAATFYRQTGASFVAAPVAFTHDGSLLQVFQVLDFLTLQGITAAGVSARLHAMCNGANLAYTKVAFEGVNGFAGIDGVATGDDMLLMHKIWKAAPEGVFYLKCKDAVVRTAPAKTWKEFVQQRRRWASKTLVYDDWRTVAVLAFVLVLNLWFFVLVAAAFFNPVYWVHALAFVFAKTVVEWPFVSSVAQFFGEEKLMRHFFFVQPLHLFYTVFVGISSQFGSYEWKGRRHRVKRNAGKVDGV